MGANSLYYGTEVGLEGGGDPDCRRTFPWENLEENKTYIEKVKEILAIKNHQTIKNGKIKIYSHKDLLLLERFDQEKTLSLAINLGRQKDFVLADENILISNNYSNQSLGEASFVVWEKYSK